MSMGIILVLLLVGCFATEDVPSGVVDALLSAVEFVEDEGLEGSVSIDSLTWWPFFPAAGIRGNRQKSRESLWPCFAMSAQTPCGCATTCGFLTKRNF